MSIISTPAIRTVAATGALALAATGATLVASPAQALSTQTLSYDCTWSGIGDFVMTVAHRVGSTDYRHHRNVTNYDDDNPTVEYGGYLPVATDLTIPAGTVEELRAHGVTAIQGPFADRVQFDGAVIDLDTPMIAYDFSTESWTLPVPVPESGPMAVSLKDRASTAAAKDTAPAGSSASFGPVDIDTDEIQGQLTTFDAQGNKTGTADVACEITDGQDLTTSIQVPVTQAHTSTSGYLRYDRGAGKVAGAAGVTGSRTFNPPTGQVRFDLKRNGRVVGSKTKALDLDCEAQAVFKAPRSGTYEMTVSYLGDDAGNFKPSQRVVSKTF